MNIKVTEEFIELMIYFICHFRQKNYRLHLAQLGGNLMLTADRFCITVYCWCVLYLGDLICPHLFRKLILIVVLQPFSPGKLDLYCVKLLVMSRKQWEGAGGTRPGWHWIHLSPQILPC